MSSTNAPRGLTLVEVLVALGLIAAAGVLATSGALALGALSTAARAEASALAAGTQKVEELLALPRADRRLGNDEVERDGAVMTRVWRVLQDEPEPGLTRIEVTTRWSEPSLTLLALVAVAP